MQLYVNGEAKIRTGTAGGNALEDLGVSVDGVRGVIRSYDDPVYTDTFGPHVPFDEQHFLQDAIVRCDMIFYDDAVLAKIRSRVGGSDGVQGAAGSLWGAGGFYFRLLITSPVAAQPYNFLFARPLDEWEVNKGTKRSSWAIRFRAIPYKGTAGSSAGAVLYNQTTT